jgi:glutaredoxin
MDRVVVYTRDNCSYCTYAKNLLEQKKIPYEEQKLDVDFDRARLVEMFPTAKTFPVITVDGFYIGGYSQLTEMINETNINNNTEQLLNG